MSDLLDPNTATSPAFSRKLFVGLGAGAAAAATTLTHAQAQDSAEFGKPHPPIVPETDPDIVVQRVQLARPDISLGAYAAWPKNYTPATPAIVMVQHVWGVDSTIRDDVRRYAKAGYVCIAPDLFARTNAPSGDGTSDIDLFRGPASSLRDDIVHGDLLAARGWASGHVPNAKIGLTGFCMGGAIAIKQLIGTHDYAAASIFYGSVRQKDTPNDASDAFAYAKTIATPMRGNYGARDTSIDPSDVRAFFTDLTVPHQYEIYPDAGHAFFDDTRKSYVRAAAADAWSKTQAWFKQYLS